MTWRRDFLIGAVVLMVVIWAYLFGWPLLMHQVGYRALAAQCAKDGGTLNEAGTVCSMPIR